MNNISDEKLEELKRGISLDDLQGKIVHIRGYNNGCQYRYISSRGTELTLETPKTKKIVTTHMKNVYPSKRTRQKIIDTYRDNLIKSIVDNKVKERFY